MRGQRIVDAIVRDLLHNALEGGAMQHAPEVTPGHIGVTVPWIIDHYGLTFGSYTYEGVVKDRATQYVRNALAKAINDGDLIKIADQSGKLLRLDGAAVYRLAAWGAPEGYQVAR